MGALAGGLSGGLAPLSWGFVSLADIPVILGLTADICGRFCWYYGFPPDEHPELPMEILAVALGGSRPDAIEPMLLRQNLREFTLRKSLIVGTLARGGLQQVAGRALGQLMEVQLTPQLAQRAGQLAQRVARRNLEQRAAQAAPRSMPLLGALLGATLNAALLYDLCEAAQAVLTDRFLERKYPDWIRRLGSEGEADEGDEADEADEAEGRRAPQPRSSICVIVTSAWRSRSSKFTRSDSANPPGLETK